MKKQAIPAIAAGIILSLSVLTPSYAHESQLNAAVTGILEGATEYNGNYYLLINSAYTWQQAKLYCEGLGGHLATVTSKGEDEVCNRLWAASGAKGCWLGASDLGLEGIWQWITSEEWDYCNWGTGEPNGGTGENALGYYASNGAWNDYSESSKYPFICEWEKEDIEYVRKTFGYITSSGVIYNNAFYYNGNVYKVFDYKMTSAEAKEYCENLGGHLATISSKKEDMAIYTYICKIGNFDCILGGSDEEEEGVWKWVTGEPFSYSNWHEGEPNNTGNNENFLQYHGESGCWNDTKWLNCFLCEWDDCCILADGTVTKHSFDQVTVIENATCTSTGKSQVTCTGCGTIVTNEVDMLPHEFGEWDVTQNASCDKDGKRTRICTNCNYKDIQSIPALNHQWGDWEIITEPTCHAPGKEEHSCIRCGVKDSQDVQQLAHDYGEYVIVSGNKLIPPIVKEKTCALCGENETVKDWSYVWVTVIAGIALLGVLIGVINYFRAFKNRR